MLLVLCVGLCGLPTAWYKFNKLLLLLCVLIANQEYCNLKIMMVVTWLYVVYVLWISCIISEMGTGFITVWFHYSSNVKLIRGMESGTILKELVYVFVLKN
jgi:hypothetical protein